MYGPNHPVNTNINSWPSSDPAQEKLRAAAASVQPTPTMIMSRFNAPPSTLDVPSPEPCCGGGGGGWSGNHGVVVVY